MKNNKGLSLIELIIAFALLALVGVAATGLLGSGSNLFRASDREINLQTEAQSAFNHMNNFIVDSQRGINFETTSGYNLLKIYNDYDIYFIKWDSTNKELYFAEAAIVNPADPEPVPADADYDLLATNVEEFTADLGEVDTKNKVKVTMKLVYDDREYVGTQEYALRNDIKANVTFTQLSADLPVGYESYVDNVVISGDVKYVSPDNNYAFSARVTGLGYPSQRVTWSVENANDVNPADPSYPGTQIDEFGTLHIGAAETSTSLTVKATSVGEKQGGGYAEDSVEVRVIRLNGITVSCDPDPAMVGRVATVSGIPHLDNSMAGIDSGDNVRVTFSLPTENDVLAYPSENLRVYNGVELYQTASMTSNCTLILGTEMENDPYFSQGFDDSGEAVLKLKVTTPLDPSQVFFKDIIVKPSDITGLGIEGNTVVARGTKTGLSATLEAQGVTSRDIKMTWAITDDAGLGDKVKIDSNTGVLTVDKNIDYTREFVLEVTATAKTTTSTKEVKTSVAVIIPKVSISVTNGSASVEKGSSDRVAFLVNGLAVTAGDVLCTSSPSLKNATMYCTANECVLSIGEKETRKMVAVKLMLKENTSISTSFTLYVLSQNEMYNVEGRKNLFIEYPALEDTGTRRKDATYDGVNVRFELKDNKTIMTVLSDNVVYDYYYDDGTEDDDDKRGVKNGVNGWWIPRTNVQGKEYYIPVPGYAAELPDEISVEYKLNYSGLLLTYTAKDNHTYVEVLNADKTTDKFVLAGTRWNPSN